MKSLLETGHRKTGDSVKKSYKTVKHNINITFNITFYSCNQNLTIERWYRYNLSNLAFDNHAEC